MVRDGTTCPSHTRTTPQKRRTPHRILYDTSHDALDDNTQMSMVSCASASLCRSPPQPPAPPPRCLSCPSRFGAASPLLPSPPSFRMETPLLHSPPKWVPFFTTCRPALFLRRLGAVLQCRSASSHAGALARRRWLVVMNTKSSISQNEVLL